MTFSLDRRIEFRDTDAAGIVHFSAFPMMEAAEHALLRSLGIPVLPASATNCPWNGAAAGDLARITANCQYCEAARFDDVLRIGKFYELAIRASNTNAVSCGTTI